jgi:hypothetical protein
MICPHTLLAQVLAHLALDIAIALCVGAALTCAALAVREGLLDRQDRRQRREAPEVPPAEERPAIPRAVRDRLAWRKLHPREAEAIARHARQLQYHDAEEAEARHA